MTWGIKIVWTPAYILQKRSPGPSSCSSQRDALAEIAFGLLQDILDQSEQLALFQTRLSSIRVVQFD